VGVNKATVASLDHLRSVPADGTVLQGLPPGDFWIINGACRHSIAPPQPTAVVVNASSLNEFACASPPTIVVVNASSPNPFEGAQAQVNSFFRSITPHGGKVTIGAVLRNGGYDMAFTALSAGRLVIRWYFIPHGAHLATAKPIVIATGRHVFARAGRAGVKIKLTAAGKRLLRYAKRLELTAKASFIPVGGPTVSVSKAITLKR
jgi:hypothetical protein